MNMEFIRKLPIPVEIKEAYPQSYAMARAKERTDLELKQIFTGESDDPDTVCALLQDEIERVRAEGVDREVFTLCKNEKYGQLVENLENVEDAASQMADFALLGQTVPQQVEMLAGLTADDADRALQAILQPDRAARVTILPNGADTEE